MGDLKVKSFQLEFISNCVFTDLWREELFLAIHQTSE